MVTDHRLTLGRDWGLTLETKSAILDLRAVNSNKRRFVLKAQLFYNPILLFAKSLLWACPNAVVELTAPQLPGEFRGRDFLFCLKNAASVSGGKI